MRSLVYGHVIGGLVALGLATAAQAGEKTYELPPFNAIDADGHIRVNVLVGKPQNIQLTHDDLVKAERFTVAVRNGVLRIKAKKKDVRISGHLKPATFTITTPALDRLTVGAGMRLAAYDINAKDFKLKVTSGAKVSVTGECGSLKVGVHTGGELYARKLACEDVVANGGTGGSMALTAQTSLDASASFGASIMVSGTPDIIDRSTSFGGSIEVGT